MNLNFGDYELREEIGKGGMATVYRAYQPNMDRDVAIKVIRSNIIDDEHALERFQQEAKVIARLEHPHILPVYDFNGHADPPYIVMRYLDGGTLKDVSMHGLLPLAEVTQVFQQITSALDYIHRQGIIHRDIKPSNIIVDQDGNVFVTDLGIARITGGLAGGRAGITASGAIVGTPGYMSPEQAMGRADINHQADIYSLGVMLFEMLTEQMPFIAEGAMALLLMHIQSPVPLASSINTDLPTGIDDIILRAMEKEPDMRYSSASQIAHELLQITGLSAGGASQLRKAAATSSTIREIRPINLDYISDSFDINTGSNETPSEQQRQITVAHVNLTDFEDILLEVNAEEANQHLAELVRQIQVIIEQEGGIIREQTGTTIQALWGVHEVREDDAENAILAALSIRDRAKSFTHHWLKDEDASPVQVGIDTGLVMVTYDEDGSLSSSGQAISYAVRIERAAPPGTVMCSYDTFRHVLGVFDALQDTPVRIRGRSEPIDVFVVQNARPRAFRLQTRGVEGIETKMVGRDSELKLLQDAMLLCIEDSETQMVTVTADAGVGKSRLLYEFSRWLDVINETVLFFEGRATQQSTNLPYSLIRSIFAFRFEILDSDSIAVMREKLLQGAKGFLGDDCEEAVAFIGQLIGFDYSDHPLVQAVLSNADVFQKRAEDYLNTFFRSIGQSATILELEDIHWADYQSLDMINQLVSENQNLPLMVICMARPQLADRRPGWGEGQDFHQRLDLKPLSKLDSRRLLREVLQMVDNIPTELRDLIVERADGNPFYVEELVKILIEDGVIVKVDDGENQRWTVLSERLKDLRVPPTLTGVLQSRLDTLPPMARLLLGRASVIGRIFWTSAVEYLHKADGFHIHNQQELLDDLRQREMVFQREKSDFGGMDEYVIKHAILRDVIYESLIKRQQRDYHRAAAEWLIEMSDERSDEYTGLIAEHYELAGEMTRAAGYLLIAGKKANAISALDQAKSLLDHALSILPEDAEDTKQTRVHILIEQIGTYYRRWQLEEVERLCHPTLALAREIDDRTSMAYVLAHLGLNFNRRGDYEAAMKHLLEANTLVDDISDKTIQIFVLRQIGNGYSLKAQTATKSLEYFERSLAISREIKNSDGEASAYNALGNFYSTMMQPEESIKVYEKGVEIVKEIGDDSMLIVLLTNSGQTYFYMGDYQKALDTYINSRVIFQKIGASLLHNDLAIAQTLVQTDASRDEIIDHLKPHILNLISSNNIALGVEALEIYIHLLIREGQFERATELIGLWKASPINDPDDQLLKLHIDRAMETKISTQLSDELIQSALARSQTMDLMKVLQEIAIEINVS